MQVQWVNTLAQQRRNIISSHSTDSLNKALLFYRSDNTFSRQSLHVLHYWIGFLHSLDSFWVLLANAAVFFEASVLKSSKVSLSLLHPPSPSSFFSPVDQTCRSPEHAWRSWHSRNWSSTCWSKDGHRLSARSLQAQAGPHTLDARRRLKQQQHHHHTEKLTATQ